MVTYLEPDILECEVKWALGSITTNKVSRNDEFQLRYLKYLKMMVLKCCTQYVSKLENPAMAIEQEKVSFHPNSKERQCQRMSKPLNNCIHFPC